MKNLSKEEVRTPKEIIDKYFPSGLHEDPEQSGLHKIFIFNAMEEYASQFKSQSEAVGWITEIKRFMEFEKEVSGSKHPSERYLAYRHVLKLIEGPSTKVSVGEEKKDQRPEG